MTLTAMLMAGGESRRMGVDKATIVFDGEMLWQRQLGLLRSLNPKELWVSARVRPQWSPEDVEAILDALPSCGPLSGITAGLSRLQTSHLLVLAIDMPNMTSDHLRNLWDLAVSGCGVIPQNSNFFEPLCAIYPAEAATQAIDALARGDVSLQLLIRDLCTMSRFRIYDIAESELPLYRNVNTPDDFG